MLTSNLMPRFHSNFFYIGFRQNVAGCSFLCPIIPRVILTLLPPPSCSVVPVVVNWCGLKIITGGCGKVSSMGQFVNPVCCAAGKSCYTGAAADEDHGSWWPV